MNPRKFRGRDMGEALRAIKDSLGPDALITETRSVADELGGGVEVTALASAPIAHGAPGPHAFPTEPPRDEIREELAVLKSMLGWLAPELDYRNDVIRSLVRHGVAPDIVARIAEVMRSAGGEANSEGLRRALSRLIPIGGVVRPGDRLVLLGPSGVGKTSGMIKLTVFETERRAGQIGWVSTDARQLAAGDPLAVYAAVLGVRYELAPGRKELKQALAKLAGCELVLIDTPAVNPRARREIERLAALFHGLAGLRRTLLLSAATNGSDLAEWVAAFRPAGVDSLIFTKTDESGHLGPLVNTAVSAGVPLAYIVSGQSLAGNLEIASAAALAGQLLGEVDARA
ncbi:MAG TPA: hypothetical protein VNN77_10480 [candidate division Zixibacteria bacterium]|nr:hypothetical protein [candidate division Zixibacteria bacterium]